MIKIITKLKHWFRREEGSATIEFCIWFPFFLGLVGSSFEASLIATRQVMLSGSVDRTVRELQLGILGNPTHTELKTILCNRAGFIPNCLSAMHIEMERISTDNWTFRTGDVKCVDLDNENEPALNYAGGGQANDLMLITVCAAFKPMMPITGLGLKLPKIQGGTHYGLVAFSAYVVEPA